MRVPLAEAKALSRELRDQGVSWRQIGIAVGRPNGVHSVRAWLDDAARLKRNAACMAYKARLPKETLRRWRLRAEARAEAKQTGEPVEAIYKRWGCE